MPKLRDPQFDPMVAPTRAGLHPHMIRSGTERRGEHSGYEGAARVNQQLGEADTALAVKGATPVPVPAPASGPGIVDWAAEHPLLVAAALIGTAYLYTRSRDAEDFEPRRNPGPATAAAPVVVMAPLATGFGTPAVAQAATPAEVKPTPRRRRTSQARDAQGHYLPAGTRKKAVTEGDG